MVGILANLLLFVQRTSLQMHHSRAVTGRITKFPGTAEEALAVPSKAHYVWFKTRRISHLIDFTETYNS